MVCSHVGSGVGWGSEQYVAVALWGVEWGGAGKVSSGLSEIAVALWGVEWDGVVWVGIVNST